jgi:GMP synthase-like glutamine amidotransferase
MSANRKRVLVFQHLDVEHPGIFRDFLAEDGFEYVPVELDAGEPIPPLEDYAALWVMGGPMDVWQVAEHPWLLPEQAAIREAVLERRLPFLGFCLGHQLLAAALGGRVGPAALPEIGIMPVERNEPIAESALLAGVPARFQVLQWHSAEVLSLPAAARCLLRSERCAVQAMSVGEHAFSMQFHVEITGETVPQWNAIPEYRQALARSLGAQGAASLTLLAQAHLPAFNALARRLYSNWRKASGL